MPPSSPGALIPPALLDLPARGWINLHFSLLPAWRGAGPVQAAIAAGDTVTGASTFQIEAGLDTGPVYGTLTTDIGAGETSGDLLDRLALSGANLLVATSTASRPASWRRSHNPTTTCRTRPRSPSPTPAWSGLGPRTSSTA